MTTPRRHGYAQCAYPHCHATVKMIDSGDGDRLIELHLIDNEVLTGHCPASLMRQSEAFSNSHAFRTLMGRADIDQIKIDLWNTRFNDPEAVPPQNYASTPKGIMHIHCMTRHLPGQPCPGRQNRSQPVGKPPVNPTSPGWVLGGREDEDVIPHDETVVPIVPRGVVGVPHGEGTGMASISEQASIANAAAVESSDAYHHLTIARDKLQESLRLYHALIGDAVSGQLQEAVTHVNNCIRSIEGALLEIDASQENGRNFVNNLFA